LNNENNRDHVLAVIAPSGIYAFSRITAWLFAVVICLVIAIFYLKILILAALLLAFIAWYKFLQIICTRYTLSRETIMIRKGIIARRYDHLELFRVKDYFVHQTVFMRIFRLMSVSLHTTDLTNNVLVLEGLPVSDITRKIRDLVQQARLKNRIFEIN
jgi:uncharacterized membrane protein YdbT with pleckstrin-like domain